MWEPVQISSLDFDTLDGIYTLYWLTNQRNSLLDGVSLSALVDFSRELNASEPKDKIFGLVSMTTWARWGQPLPKGIQPNYRESLRNCMRSATRVMIEEDKNLDVLLQVGHRDSKVADADDVTWPSWTPVWSGAPKFHDMGLWLLNFSAHDNRPMALHILAKNNLDCLRLEGFIVDIFQYSCRPIARDDVASLSSWQRFVQTCKPYFEDEQFTSTAKLLSFLSADRERHKEFTISSSEGIKALMNAFRGENIIFHLPGGATLMMPIFVPLWPQILIRGDN